MHNLLKLTSISNLLFILLLPESSRSDSPSGSSSGVFLLILAGGHESMCQEWVGRSIYLCSFISAKDVFILQDQLLWHWSRDKCYPMCIINKWLSGDQY